MAKLTKGITVTLAVGLLLAVVGCSGSREDIRSVANEKRRYRAGGRAHGDPGANSDPSTHSYSSSHSTYSNTF